MFEEGLIFAVIIQISRSRSQLTSGAGLVSSCFISFSFFRVVLGFVVQALDYSNG
jgi:hypothetical protein